VRRLGREVQIAARRRRPRAAAIGQTQQRVARAAWSATQPPSWRSPRPAHAGRRAVAVATEAASASSCSRPRTRLETFCPQGARLGRDTQCCRTRKPIGSARGGRTRTWPLGPPPPRRDWPAPLPGSRTARCRGPAVASRCDLRRDRATDHPAPGRCELRRPGEDARIYRDRRPSSCPSRTHH